MKSPYKIDRKSSKWWHRIAFHFLDATVLNVHILHKTASQDDNVRLKQFRTCLVMGMEGAQALVKGKKQNCGEIPTFKKKLSVDV